MCLHEQPIKAIPPETVRVAKAVFAKGNPYLETEKKCGKARKLVDWSFKPLE